MPIYEYCCPNCGLKFERLRSLSAADTPLGCPQCGAEAKRLVSLFSSFSKDSQGTTTRIGGSTPSCSTCRLTSCDTCG